MTEAKGSSTAPSSTPAEERPDTRQWPHRSNVGTIPGAALIIPDAASRSEVSPPVQLDYTKFSTPELHLCQAAITREMRDRDTYTYNQMENIKEQNASLAAQLADLQQKRKEAEDRQKKAEQKQRDAENSHKVVEDRQKALAHMVEEACRSLPDFDVQGVAEPEQKVEKLKEYAKQSHSQVEKMQADHEAEIAELKLRLRPETPPHLRAHRVSDIQASAKKISDLVGSASRVLAESVAAWEKLQENLETQKLHDLMK